MHDSITQMLQGQFEAALCMLNDCIRKCPVQHWDDKIANDTFRQVAYHTLFYIDYYLSPNEAAFTLRELHHRGGDERNPVVSPGLSKDETLQYVSVCRDKALHALAAETAQSLQSPSGFERLPFSRGELYIYVIRHVQHHTGQLSALLRKFADDGERWWVKTGWR
jgi:uncharacterized damage-inducible protein DinB